MNVGERLSRPEAEVKLSSIHSKIVQRDKAQSAQAFGILTCDYSSADYEPLKVLQNIASGMAGRFWTEVRDKKSLAYSVYGYQSSGAHAGAFVCYMATSPENAEKARELTLGILSGFKDEPVSSEELERAKNYIAGTWAIYLQPNALQANIYGRWELAGKGCQAVWEYPENIRKVSAEQLMDVAAKYFDTKYYALGMVKGKGATVKQRE
jgi:zinc protease